MITDNLGRAAGNGHRVLEHLYQHPIVSVNEVQDLIGTTYPAANDLVARMEESGILQESCFHSRAPYRSGTAKDRTTRSNRGEWEAKQDRKSVV